MDFCILGLLLHREMALYDINQAFSQSLGLFYQASLGSLQITLKKLLETGFIEISLQEPAGRRKRTYRITALGRTQFFAIMESELPASRLEETALARIHFLGHASVEVRLRVIDSIIRRVESELRKLEEITAVQNSIPEAQREAYRFPFETLDYGIQSHRLALDWFKDLYRREASRTAK